MYRPSTIPDSISAAKNDPITHDKLFLKATYTEGGDKDPIVIFNYSSLITKYIEEIKKEYIALVELSNEEYNRYKFNPKLFCSETYGTPELWSTLLLINNMISQIDFTSKKIYAFKTNITDFLDEMFILEEMNINENMQYIEDITKK